MSYVSYKIYISFGLLHDDNDGVYKWNDNVNT